MGVNLNSYTNSIRSGFTCIVIFPLSLMRKFTGLRYIAILSLSSIIYLTIVIILEFPSFIHQNDYSEIEWIKLDSSVFSSISITLFSYVNHMNTASIFSEMKRPVQSRMQKANSLSVGFEMVVYLLIAVFGALSTLSNTPGLFYLRSPPVGSSSDTLMLIG